jgi:DNA-binding response OmpR family regulator
VVKTVLILVPDVGFTFWLGQVLSQAGYQALAAESVPAASALIATLGISVDLLVVALTLGSDAREFIVQLRKGPTYVPVIGVIDSCGLHEAIPGIDLMKTVPATGDESESKDWLDAIRRCLNETHIAR